MASNETRRLSPPEMQADRNAVLALRDLESYVAVNPDYGLATLDSLDAALTAAQQAERRAQTALDAARDATTAAAWALHKAVLGAKSQVIAQFGPDSNAVSALGLKKKSEYRRPPRRSSKTSIQP